MGRGVVPPARQRRKPGLSPLDNPAAAREEVQSFRLVAKSMRAASIHEDSEEKTSRRMLVRVYSLSSPLRRSIKKSRFELEIPHWKN
jgi:hypothetical protein